MIILLVSDTHGDIKDVIKAYEYTAKKSGVDFLIHLGDLRRDADKIQEIVDVPVEAVLGNMDSLGSGEVKIVDFECGKVLITHGHAFGVKQSLDRLIYACEEGGYIGALFGHTHVPYNRVVEGIRLINPGSISKPKYGRDGTFAILEVDDTGIKCDILEISQIEIPIDVEGDGEIDKEPKVGKKKKIPSGYLRDLMNFSDRF